MDGDSFIITFSEEWSTGKFIFWWLMRFPTLFKSILPQHISFSHTFPISSHSTGVFFSYGFNIITSLSGARSFHTVSKQVKNEVTPALGFDMFLNFTCSLSKGRARKSGAGNVSQLSCHWIFISRAFLFQVTKARLVTATWRAKT